MGVLRSTNATPLEGLREVSTGMSWLDLPLWSGKFHPPLTPACCYIPATILIQKLLLPGIFEKLGALPMLPAPSLLSVDSMDVGSPHARSYFLLVLRSCCVSFRSAIHSFKIKCYQAPISYQTGSLVFQVTREGRVVYCRGESKTVAMEQADDDRKDRVHQTMTDNDRQ